MRIATHCHRRVWPRVGSLDATIAAPAYSPGGADVGGVFNVDAGASAAPRGEDQASFSVADGISGTEAAASSTPLDGWWTPLCMAGIGSPG